MMTHARCAVGDRNQKKTWIIRQTASTASGPRRGVAPRPKRCPKSSFYAHAPFFFKPFGLPTDAEVANFEEPRDSIAHVSWHDRAKGEGEHRLDMNHIRLPEELPGNRLRILTQERQIGKSATVMGRMSAKVDGYQARLYGIMKPSQRKCPIKDPKVLRQ